MSTQATQFDTENPSAIQLPVDEGLAVGILEETKLYASFDKEKLANFIFRLNELHAIVVVEGLRAPRATRTEINNLLRRVVAQKKPLEELLEDPLTSEVLFKTWLDFNAVYPKRNRSEPSDYDKLYRRPKEVAALVAHLRARIKEFDELSSNQQSDWYFNANTRREVVTRQMLYPFIQRGSPTSAETYATRFIAALYESVSGKPFAITPVLDGGRRKRKDRYAGPGIRFACAVIKALSLSAFFAFDRSENVNSDPSDNGDSGHVKKRRKLEPRYLDPKLEKSPLIYSEDIASDSRVARMIGDTWINDKKRATPKPLSIYRGLEA